MRGDFGGWIGPSTTCLVDVDVDYMKVGQLLSENDRCTRADNQVHESIEVEHKSYFSSIAITKARKGGISLLF